MASKTNAMRLLDSAKIEYTAREYPLGGPVSAVDVSAFFGQNPRRMFKTLVTEDTKGGHFVFCIPGNSELDLKKAASAAGSKKIEMLKQKNLLKLTGYIHGGCSPVGMKKLFPTIIDRTALEWETVYVSGGKIGLQIEINPYDLESLIGARFENIVKQEEEK